MTYSVPVIEPASGEATKATRSATSFGLAGRPIGMPPRDFIKPCRAPLVIRARLLRQFCDQSNGCFRLHPAGRNPDHADTLRAYLLRQTLAVIGERSLRRGIRDRCV